ncbi:amidase [Alkalimarinus alittae]|uniref:Amidase n=1 Tax=Alkalimarinus alittae TaxID=2961619 RepID=A0ABY6MZV5_9ALTE|nr:amidase [Alkalimarinus alittae]UZE95376.1 amidase [Alkalimarinus alittae]
MPYDLKSLRVPRLWGLPLKTLVTLLENGYSRSVLESPLIKEAGVDKLRALTVDDAPIMTPKYPKGRSISASNAKETLDIFDTQPLPMSEQPGFHFQTIFDFAKAYRDGSTSPVLVAEQVIHAINVSNEGKTPLRAIINVNEQDILNQAKASQIRIDKGKALSLLDGVPVAVKDEIDMVPYATTVGTHIYGQDHSVPHDATVVARLRAAGALLIGKANMHEIGIGVTGANPHFGVCRNPYHPLHHTGGSSSGSASAVAAGLCPLSIGADGGGSIRIPAALCGVVGLKSTWSRVSEFGAAPLCWSVAHVGPLGATVDDVALGYSVTAGPDTQDDVTLEQPHVHLKDYLKNDLTGLRVGIYTPWFNHADKEVVDRCTRALKILESQGATRHEITIDNLDAQRIAHMVTISSEMLTAVEEEYKKDASRFALDTRVNLAIASTFSSTDYVKAQKIRGLAIKAFMDAFEDVDVIITPSSAIPAPEINSKALPDGESNLSDLTEIMRFATTANFTGFPALTINAGYTEKGLPIGVQLMGRPWEESLLLRMGRVIENGVKKQKPKVHFSLF